MMRKYTYFFVKINGEWMEIEHAFAQFGFDFFPEDEFNITVEANNWKEAKEKILIAAKCLA